MRGVDMMRIGSALAAALAGSALMAQATAPQPPAKAGPSPAAPASQPIDLTIIHVQVLLDRLGFGPGVIDGRGGMSTQLALRGFQKAHGLAVTGTIDRPTLAALHPYAKVRPLRLLAISQADVAGPFYKIPKDEDAQAKLPALTYESAVEKLGERFHTTPQTLAALNPGGRIVPGAQLRFPNVLPGSRDYDPKLKPEWRQTLSDLNVDARQPVGDLVLVSKHEGVLKVMRGDTLLAQFPATMGSKHDPLPIGTWKIYGADTNPKFHFNPALFWDASSKDTKAMLPPGPNGPVGVVWLDLSKPHYGIHGTPHPELIGRTESHGCIRLSNWDAARLSLMVKPGTTAKFVE